MQMVGMLGLTDVQRTQVDDILYHSRSARIAIEARKDLAELDLHHAMMAATLDEKAISKALDTLNTAKAELGRNRVDQMVAIRKLLTPDQWAKAAAMMREHGDEGDAGARGGRGEPGDRCPGGEGDMKGGRHSGHHEGDPEE